MNNTDALLDQLLRHWAKQGLQHGQPALADQIEAFEHRYQVTLPDDLRFYVSLVNGIDGGQLAMDDSDFSFWNLDQIRTVAEETNDPEGHELFVFADFSLWAHAYAVRLSAAQPGGSEVFLVGGASPERVAPSFDAFLRGYLANDPVVLYGSAAPSAPTA